ncbi:hypothetical protein SAMN05421786_1159 [Chryseobacterium ureilyticum]|uniref:Uncharacterized protein n=1 Tax=Chryseobacterium ureilyticum TaxID=373668 RepID=A0A1N7QRP6_9FLAO|nr:hypothetical protein [Chryseobacterium ureilyticum]SIT25466.1 hypothetical protein SAMN05421786_1159 [Chryseobacterium ureilyticum]
MDETILKRVLQLDSLIGFLSWQERTDIHKNHEISSSRIKLAYEWIIKENWKPPKMKYGQDRLLYFYDPINNHWLWDEDYLKVHPQYKELKNLKNI